MSISKTSVVEKASAFAFGRPLVMNVLRSIIVEAIVSEALPDWEWCSHDYAAYDFRHSDGTRLEVKQSAARQTWSSPRHSRASWDIRPRTGYWKEGTEWVPGPGRNADIYVFAHHPVTGDEADHRDALQWRFFVIATSDLPDTATLSEPRAASLSTAATFAGLASVVDAIRRSRGHPGL